MALAGVAKSQGYCCPKLSGRGSGGAKLNIVQGRHPVVSQMKMGDQQYVANDTSMEVRGSVMFYLAFIYCRERVKLSLFVVV